MRLSGIQLSTRSFRSFQWEGGLNMEQSPSWLASSLAIMALGGHPRSLMGALSYSEGWEQNGLYEFFRAKMRARRRKGQEKRNR